MTPEDSFKLDEMHKQISQSGLTAFDTTYLEFYVQLLTKSLEGKGDIHSVKNASLRPHNSMV